MHSCKEVGRVRSRSGLFAFGSTAQPRESRARLPCRFSFIRSQALIMNLRPLVMKFGGTSVEDARAFERVSLIIQARTNSLPVVVVSAMSKVTDALLFAAQKASEGEWEEALRSLDTHFRRHLQVAQELLGASERAGFGSFIEPAQSNAAILLGAIANRQQPFALLQDALLATGETLSANLLA